MEGCQHRIERQPPVGAKQTPHAGHGRRASSAAPVRVQAKRGDIRQQLEGGRQLVGKSLNTTPNVSAGWQNYCQAHREFLGLFHYETRGLGEKVILAMSRRIQGSIPARHFGHDARPPCTYEHCPSAG
jgi:hypothetical protein